MDEDEFEQPNKVKRFIKEAVRVIRITKKPDSQEYKSLVKVTGLGTAVIGAIGFVLFLIKQLLFT
ncbi:TPA: protein translocase SEC61 complex subunit gamma [Candidatus Woesearchaeota archaeon]|nr:protein translocase SEC61 complex subunit gamma [Candidatus Woesearchaeota archaeon]HIH13379.1 protein translocase SEC61 complex subunit gamma [Candidatus Woesearchaeota archaeon]